MAPEDRLCESCQEATNVKIVTAFVYPPIPIRNMDWCATTDDYEPGCPMGNGATEAEAIADLKEQLLTADIIARTARKS